MDTLTIKLKEQSYDVTIRMNSLQQFAELQKDHLTRADRVGIVVDETVYPLYGERLERSLQDEEIDVSVFVVPKGEKAKTMDVYQRAQSFFLQRQFTRNSLLIAFGGGAVGDLTGFIAATFMRGIPFIQLPTTILAHDSAVGGKTAINMPEGKNMVGAFHQPKAVLFDPLLFKTLPEREWRSGMAELLKHAYISDDEWTKQLLRDQTFIRPSLDVLASRLLKGVQVKAKIVEADTYEKGSRKFLNFGHTFGHAIEAATDFGAYSHGECIMIGMGYALLLSEMKGQIASNQTDQLIRFAKSQGYSFDPIFQYDFEQLFAYMATDKKVSFGQIHFVILRQIGKPEVVVVEKEVLQKTFEAYQKRVKGIE